jgi:hypothetical protein
MHKLTYFLAFVFLLTACDFSTKSETQLLKKADCRANAPCVFPNGVKVWLNDSSLSPETPFTLFSELPTGYTITNAQLEGVTMYMGYIPQNFIKQNNVWQSNTMVGICSEKNMLWNLVLTVSSETNTTKETLNYYFYVTY